VQVSHGRGDCTEIGEFGNVRCLALNVTHAQSPNAVPLPVVALAITQQPFPMSIIQVMRVRVCDFIVLSSEQSNRRSHLSAIDHCIEDRHLAAWLVL
jgi:hypothetical protein